MVKDLRVLPQLLLHASRISGLMSHRFPEKPAAAKRLRGYAASLKSPTCASRARLNAGRAVQQSI
jgi:hypothetical protein